MITNYNGQEIHTMPDGFHIVGDKAFGSIVNAMDYIDSGMGEL